MSQCSERSRSPRPAASPSATVDEGGDTATAVVFVTVDAAAPSLVHSPPQQSESDEQELLPLKSLTSSKQQQRGSAPNEGAASAAGKAPLPSSSPLTPSSSAPTPFTIMSFMPSLRLLFVLGLILMVCSVLTSGPANYSAEHANHTRELERLHAEHHEEVRTWKSTTVKPSN